MLNCSWHTTPWPTTPWEPWPFLGGLGHNTLAHTTLAALGHNTLAAFSFLWYTTPWDTTLWHTPPWDTTPWRFHSSYSKHPGQANVAQARKLESERAALQRASVGFTAADLGQGQLGGGGERTRRNRAELLQAVLRLGQPLSVEAQANWARWQRRFDDAGVQRYGRAWGAKLKVEMATLLPRLVAGEADAFLRWKSHMSRAWCLEAGQLVVPAIEAPP